VIHCSSEQDLPRQTPNRERISIGQIRVIRQESRYEGRKPGRQARSPSLHPTTSSLPKRTNLVHSASGRV
jgi:hypothetical protein